MTPERPMDEERQTGDPLERRPGESPTDDPDAGPPASAEHAEEEPRRDQAEGDDR